MALFLEQIFEASACGVFGAWGADGWCAFLGASTEQRFEFCFGLITFGHAIVVDCSKLKVQTKVAFRAITNELALIFSALIVRVLVMVFAIVATV